MTPGRPVAPSLNGVWGRTATTGDRLLSYSVNQGAPANVLTSSSVQVLSLSAIAGPESITTKANTQFRVTSPVAWVSITNSTIPADAGWFDSAAKVNVVFDSVWNQTSTGSRESVMSYTLNGGAKTSVPRSGNQTFSISLSMAQGQSIALTSVTQYLLTVVGPPHSTATPPSPTGDSYFDSGSKVTFTVPRAWNGTSGQGSRETLLSYSLDGDPAASVPPSNTSASFTTAAVTFTQAHTLDFNAVAQDQVVFQFLDGLGTKPVRTHRGRARHRGLIRLDVELPPGLAGQREPSQRTSTWKGASVGRASFPPRNQVKVAP